MKCKNCGANIDQKAKFCEWCGRPITLESQPQQNVEIIQENKNFESTNNVESIELEKTIVVDPIVSEPVVNNLNVENEQENSNFGNINDVESVDLEKTIVVDPIVTEPAHNNTNIVKDTNKINEQSNLISNKEKNNKMLLIIGGIILAVIAVVLVVFAYTKTSTSTIGVLKKAILNLSEQGKNSATVDTKISLATNTGESFSLSATIKAEKKNDNELDMSIKVNKSLLFDEMNVYALVNKEEATMYIQSTLIDMLGMTKSSNPIWIYYKAALDEFASEDAKYDVDFEGILEKDNFVYIEEINKVKRYQLIIDQEVVDRIKTKAETIEDLEVKETFDSIGKLEKPIKIDFYITESNELSKIELDISDQLSEDVGLSSFIISIGFSELNSTRVEIPSDAKNAVTDLETYVMTNTFSDLNFNDELDVNNDMNNTDFGF